MEITRCQRCGFCHGVRRALALAEGLRRDGWNVSVDGELVHNPSVLRRLEADGIRRWDGESRRWGSRDCLLIRAHGISPARRKELRRLPCAMFDGTCPDVARVAGLIRRFRRKGYFSLFHGDGQHPEVVGLAGHGGGDLAIVREECDLVAVRETVGTRPVALLAQTTDGVEQFSQFAQLARRHFPNLEVCATICPSVRERQGELADRLATGDYDLVVVIAGPHSSNGRALVAVARNAGRRVLAVEDAAALAGHFPLRAERVLIAGGTSTPPEAADAVEAVLHAELSRMR
jgi:4-hydroxy-3-methylbut-2-enyl diphosphate reductase